ncbi:MAG: hypothetical protein AAF492_25800, partial [Verrucomicrobiota bacterium]
VIHIDAEWNEYRQEMRAQIALAELKFRNKFASGYVDCEDLPAFARRLKAVNVPSVAYFRDGNLYAIVGCVHDVAEHVEYLINGWKIDTRLSRDDSFYNIRDFVRTRNPDARNLARLKQVAVLCMLGAFLVQQVSFYRFTTHLARFLADYPDWNMPNSIAELLTGHPWLHLMLIGLIVLWSVIVLRAKESRIHVYIYLIVMAILIALAHHFCIWHMQVQDMGGLSS